MVSDNNRTLPKIEVQYAIVDGHGFDIILEVEPEERKEKLSVIQLDNTVLGVFHAQASGERDFGILYLGSFNQKGGNGRKDTLARF